VIPFAAIIPNFNATYKTFLITPNIFFIFFIFYFKYIFVVLCGLVNELVTEIDNVGYKNKDSYEYSVKQASEYSVNFLTKTLGITD